MLNNTFSGSIRDSLNMEVCEDRIFQSQQFLTPFSDKEKIGFDTQELSMGSA